MSEDEALAALGVLIGATPGPWTDDVVSVWIEAFERLDQPNTLRTVCMLAAEEHRDRYRIPLGEVVARYWEQTRYQRAKALPSGVAQCDGSGWMPTAGGMRPCPRCNPGLHTVWSSADLLERYRHGASLHELGVGVTKNRKGEMRWENGRDPVRCAPAPDGGLDLVRPAIGVAAARAAYEQERRSMGLEANVEQFDRWLSDAR